MIKSPICIYPTDSSEKRFVEPIVAALSAKGYPVDVDTTMSVKSTVGLFLAHRPANNPRLADTSVCMVHDLSQSHFSWPNFWQFESWGAFDYGILPNNHWAEMFAGAFISDTVNNLVEKMLCYEAEDYIPRMPITLYGGTNIYPRNGMKVIGWPGFDRADFKRKKLLRKEKRLSLVYAPSWEFENRQDTFLNAVADLEVKVYVKQHYWEGLDGWHLRQIQEMADAHANRWPNVEILDPKTNIFDVIALCDVLFSEESSTIIEAAIAGVVPIAVSDWMVPDRDPPRQPNVPYDFIKKIKQSEIKATVRELLNPEVLVGEKQKLANIQALQQPSKSARDDIADLLIELLNTTTKGALVAE